jgi:hypothetical protein
MITLRFDEGTRIINIYNYYNFLSQSYLEVTNYDILELLAYVLRI